jgi:CDP-glycerol glycerophosphotransferase (TagB/SpsB family)
MADHLDIDAFADALGETHVLLLRGHRFHAGRGDRRAVLDVTDHPEINDLVLASDVAVLDYSSLRFDVALTGTPMVFLVPDLAAYDAGTRAFLQPFRDTAPGPLVGTTEQVIEEVRDPARLRDRWAADIAATNDRWNPYQDGRAAERAVEALLALREQTTS